MRDVPSVVRQIMEGALCYVCLWAERCKLGINQIKTEQIRVAEFHLLHYLGTMQT